MMKNFLQCPECKSDNVYTKGCETTYHRQKWIEEWHIACQRCNHSKVFEPNNLLALSDWIKK